MGLYQSIAGQVRVSLTSADLTGSFYAICNAGIVFTDACQQGDLTAEFTLRRQDYPKLRAVCRRRGDRLKLRHRAGIYWTMKGLLSRPVLMMGLFLLVALVFFLPTRVLFVEVEGNSNIATRKIQEAAADCGICFGANRREVRSERMKNALLEALPQLQWAGVNTYGCVARISVRERSMIAGEEEKYEFGNVVALRDGVITSCTATRGNPICSVGQAVSKGEVLISGYTDLGICIRAVQAEGEVYAQTRHHLEVILPANYLQRTQVGDTKRKISLLLGKKRINLWKDSGISPDSCGRMYAEYYVVLPGGFQLPLGIAVDSYTSWTVTEGSMPEETARQLLEEFAAIALSRQMVAGSVQSKLQAITSEPDHFRLRGDYICIEMIAAMQRLQIGEDHEQTD